MAIIISIIIIIIIIINTVARSLSFLQVFGHTHFGYDLEVLSVCLYIDLSGFPGHSEFWTARFVTLADGDITRSDFCADRFELDLLKRSVPHNSQGPSFTNIEHHRNVSDSFSISTYQETTSPPLPGLFFARWRVCAMYKHHCQCTGS